MSTIDDFVKNNASYAKQFGGEALEGAPRRKVAVVACMDARMDIPALLGLTVGDAHVIRNAGGAVTNDVIRSLVISQRKLGTEEIVLIHHTRCGMATFDGAEFAAELADETGSKPPFAMETFADVDTAVRAAIERVTATPWLLHKEVVRGFVYDTDTGELREVT